MSILDSIQKKLDSSKKSFSSFTTSLSRKADNYNKEQAAYNKRFTENIELTGGTAFTPVIPYLAAKKKLPGPIQRFAEKDSGAIVNFAKGIVFGDVKETRANIGIYDKLMAGKPITEMERKRLKNFNDDQLMNIVGSVDGPTSKNFKPVSSISDDALKAAAKVSKKESKYLSSVNMGRLYVPNKVKESVREVIEPLKTEIEKETGKRISQDAVIQAAKEANVLKKVLSKDDIMQEAAASLKTRQNLARVATLFEEVKTNPDKAGELADATRELVESFKVVNSMAKKEGTLLTMRNIDAGDPELVKVIKGILSKNETASEMLDDLITLAQKVDFTDMSSMTNFYRKYVKAGFFDKLSEYRYTNMLSSPKTHLVNALSNTMQTVLRPVDKMASGTMDLVGSSLTGRARQKYVMEVPEYARGAVNSIPDAFRDSWRAFKGNVPLDRPDIGRFPALQGTAGKLYTTPLRALEAADVFFKKIISSGEYESLVYRELKKGGGKALSAEKLALLKSQADNVAQFYTFRSELGDATQGSLFKSMDRLTESLTKHEGVRWIVPFVRTPMNILKQGIERTPGLGALASVGAAEADEVLARNFVGSTVFAMAGYLALSGRTTAGVPKDYKQRAKFYQDGKIPYAIRVGDTWVQYNKLGPIAYPMALAANLNEAFANDKGLPKKKRDTQLENVAEGLLNMVGYFTSESYVDNLGSVYDAIQEGDVDKFNKILANLTEQMIPYDAFLRTITRLTDDVYRDPEGIMERVQTNLPGISKDVRAYRNPTGTKSKRSYNEFNAISPINISKSKRRTPKTKIY